MGKTEGKRLASYRVKPSKNQARKEMQRKWCQSRHLLHQLDCNKLQDGRNSTDVGLGNTRREINSFEGQPDSNAKATTYTIVRSVNLMCFWSVFSVKSEGKQGEGMPSNHYTIGCIQGSPLDLAISLLHLLRRRKCILLVINRCRTLHALSSTMYILS